MAPKFPYLICCKTVAKHHNTVCCDICNKWVHIACNNMNTNIYPKLRNCKAPWYCKKKSMPFSESLKNFQSKELIPPNLKNYFSDN